MANKILFGTGRGARAADTLNQAGGAAYQLDDARALAQLAVTGTLSDTYYMNAETHLDDLMTIARRADPQMVAKTAVWARREGHMKDIPALLTALLSVCAPELFPSVFTRVIDNGRMLRTFVQIMRSGVIGRQSLGSMPKRMVQAWLNTASDKVLLAASVGQSPSIADVIRMVHPKPASAERDAFFAWLIGKPCDVELLPDAVRDWIAFKAGTKGIAVPDVPFQMLTSLPLSARHWAKIAERGGWQMTRMNLNTFQRQGVFGLTGRAQRIAAKLADRHEIRHARVFPYQLMVAWMHANPDLPECIRGALQDAMEIATANVPKINGVVAVCPDVSGSMSWSLTGARHGAESKVRCIDVAALTTAAVLRANPQAYVLPFDVDVVGLKLNPRDSIMTNAEKLAAIGGGGTACSAPIARLNKMRTRVDTVILVSDNESWADRGHAWGRGTPMMKEWIKLKRRNPDAKLVCLDITPNRTTPAHERADILNIGGFSDRVFDLISAFSEDRLGPDHWISEIRKVRL